VHARALGLTGRLSPLPLRLARGFVIAGLVAAFVATLGWAIADAWHHDDACPIAAWECRVGNVGLATAAWAGIAAAASLFMALASLTVYAVRRLLD
jgi:hypothetical protein